MILAAKMLPDQTLAAKTVVDQTVADQKTQKAQAQLTSCQ